MMILSFTEILALYPGVLIGCEWACGSFAFLSLSLSDPSVCAMFSSSEESEILSAFKAIFVFLIFNVMKRTTRKKI